MAKLNFKYCLFINSLIEMAFTKKIIKMSWQWLVIIHTHIFPLSKQILKYQFGMHQQKEVMLGGSKVLKPSKLFYCRLRQSLLLSKIIIFSIKSTMNIGTYTCQMRFGRSSAYRLKIHSADVILFKRASWRLKSQQKRRVFLIWNKVWTF